MPKYDIVCTSCRTEFLDIIHSIKDPHPVCIKCGNDTETLWKYVSTISTQGDECDIIIRHGACWPDGSPRRYRSKAEIKKVAYEQGWTLYGDTPKPNQRLEERRAIEREKR